MLNQIQDYQTIKDLPFIKSDIEIINYLKRKDQTSSKILFRYITGFMGYDKEAETELRGMLESNGYKLNKSRIFRTANRLYRDLDYLFDASTWYYSISNYRRPGCYPCGIRKDNIWMSRCLHWKNCHYGISGKCELAQITMN